jgi:hypothetical protein
VLSFGWLRVLVCTCSTCGLTNMRLAGAASCPSLLDLYTQCHVTPRPAGTRGNTTVVDLLAWAVMCMPALLRRSCVLQLRLQCS